MSNKSSKPELIGKDSSADTPALDSGNDTKNASSTATTSSRHGKNEKKDKKDEREHPSSRRMHSTSRSAVIGQDLRKLANWSLRFIIVVAAGYILYKLCQFIWVGLLPTILAIIICSALWPPVKWLTNHKVPSWIASLGMLLVVLGVVSGILSAIAPSIASQINPISQKTVQGLRDLQHWLLGPPFNVNQTQLNRIVASITDKIQSSSTQIASAAINGVSTASNVVVTLLITFMLCFFFLKDGSKVLPWVKRVVGMPAYAHIEELTLRCWTTLGGFIRTQCIVSAIDAVGIGIGMIVLKVPLAGPLAIITFMGGFIPIVGAFVSGFLAVLVAWVGVSFKAAIIMLIVIIVVQQLEGNVLSPILQSNAMDLHPVIVLLVVSAGGSLYGIVGAFLAVPITAVIAVILRYIVESWDERAKIVVTNQPSEQPETKHTKMRRWLRRRSSSLRNFVHDEDNELLHDTTSTEEPPAHVDEDAESTSLLTASLPDETSDTADSDNDADVTSSDSTPGDRSDDKPGDSPSREES